MKDLSAKVSYDVHVYFFLLYFFSCTLIHKRHTHAHINVPHDTHANIYSVIREGINILYSECSRCKSTSEQEVVRSAAASSFSERNISVSANGMKFKALITRPPLILYSSKPWQKDVYDIHSGKQFRMKNCSV